MNTQRSGCFLIVYVAIVAVIALVVAPLFIGGLIYLGWNWAIAPIFAIKSITFFWQAIGLAFIVIVLTSIFKRRKSK